MAKFEWQKPAIDATIAIGGGSLVKTYLIDGVAAISNLLTAVPADVMGIDVKLLIAGVAALVVAKNYLMK